MQYWRCQCGESEYYESGMYPADCAGCDKCGTTFAQSAGEHKQRAGHDLVIRYDQMTGQPRMQRCNKCHQAFDLSGQSLAAATAK